MVQAGRRVGRHVDTAEDGRAPDAVAFSTACRSAAILRRTQPVYVRWPDLRDRNWSHDRSSG